MRAVGSIVMGARAGFAIDIMAVVLMYPVLACGDFTKTARVFLQTYRMWCSFYFTYIVRMAMILHALQGDCITEILPPLLRALVAANICT
mmetsp:Transcript_50785/g.157205  ORF Transcript_50785/g.157205 Transcript_50785/m.157205 type:complete len:90 (+) Transcript_50785:98-367(+)